MAPQTLSQRQAALKQLLHKEPFHSKFAPKMHYQAHFKGIPIKSFRRYAPMTAGFSVATVIFLAFFAEEIPPVRKDIFMQIPIIGNYWSREVAPEDNPF